MASLVHHERALELDHDGPVLIDPSSPYAHDADVRSGFRFTLLEDLAPRIDGVAFEDRIREAYLVPPEVGHDILREVRDGLTGHERQGERRVDQRSTKLGLAGIDMVKMDRVGIHRQQGEPDVVGGEDGPAQRVVIDVADLEILVDAPRPAFFDAHTSSP